MDRNLFSLTACALLSSVAVSLAQQTSTEPPGPAWWGQSGVKNHAGSVNSFSPVRVGQAKHMAYRAMLELNQALAAFDLPGGGAGEEIQQMVNSWRIDPGNAQSGWKTHDVNQVLNQGQLKAITKPFYDRLAALGLWPRGVDLVDAYSTVPAGTPLPHISGTKRVEIKVAPPLVPAEWAHTPRYPWKFWVPSVFWAAHERDTLGLQPANLGQLKHCFNFDCTSLLIARGFLFNGQPVDSDGDSLSNLAEILGGGNPNLAGDVDVYLAERLRQDGVTAPMVKGSRQLSNESAARLLSQASWGPTWETIAEVKSLGIEGWINKQLYNDPFRTPGQLVNIPWLDGVGTGLTWQNLWYPNWPAGGSATANRLHGGNGYAGLASLWAGAGERGPYADAAFPKRGIEPYVFYLQWRKMVKDQPLWINRLHPTVAGATDAPLPFPYILGPVYANAMTTEEAIPSGNMDDAWLRRALYDSDQLRQRVAWAFSQILVTSNLNGFAAGKQVGVPSLANYYDMLTEKSFGNFTDLLTSVTFHPMMGVWLTYHWNGGAVDVNDTSTFPDGNYAREVMQLFTMGLYELNMDGTPKLDQDGLRIPTYTQDDILGLSRVFTGMIPPGQYHFATLPFRVFTNQQNFALHDRRSKTFLGLTFPANPAPTEAQAQREVVEAIRHLTQRPSVAPFMSRQLIQHLVSSNPSSAYVRRVAQVFASNKDASDQLAKVVKAILMDPEARHAGVCLASTTTGRLKDPMQRLLGLMRAFNAGLDYSGGRYDLRNPNQNPLDGPNWGAWSHWNTDGDISAPIHDFQQMPFMAPSVFSFFRPGFSPAGEISNARLRAPEFQLLTPAALTSSIGRVWTDTDSSSHMLQDYVLPAGFSSHIYHSATVAVRNHLFSGGLPLTTDPNLDLRGKALRLNFAGRPAAPGSPAIAGTALSPAPSGNNPPSASSVEAFLTKLNTLLCNGRMSPKTRASLKSILTSPADPRLMSANDPHRWERLAVQLLWPTREAAILK
ncbi:DUF1800 domain-containing protein [Phragmitibacter flavus]|uniref:DUF1800 domain-containing protein n=1 Tax=Phragmitibacter flavus TaxID=2576071 RepID=A0A5R8KGF5_9BACT|nr:DUF1800 family protein [Phragmitibacter flavus]TLD71035.1 DUF1800 domain-containing protein [Phragmitibacter flavus]